MYLSVNRRDRDALYDGLLSDPTAVGDIYKNLSNDKPIEARRLRRRFEVEMRLLDDLGWEGNPDQERFELTMPGQELRPLIERIHWRSVGSLTDSPEELIEEAIQSLTNATSACPEILAMLAEDDLLDPDGRQGAQPEADTAQ